MAIPAPLAYPPTALRNVAAGLVVGNPVGSSGSRAKALTSAELKAIVEASGISYLPLSGGTLTGPITGTGGLIEHRDGLTAQCLDIFETYTSGTNNGKLRLKATSSGHQIGSARASSGSNRAVQLGHFDASDVFAAMASFDSAANSITFTVGGVARLTVNTSQILCRHNLIPSVNVLDIGLSGTPWRDLWLSRDIVFVPSSSRTLSANRQFTVEMNSNTAGNLVYRGSDGTTRRMALTFS